MCQIFCWKLPNQANNNNNISRCSLIIWSHMTCWQRGLPLLSCWTQGLVPVIQILGTTYPWLLLSTVGPSLRCPLTKVGVCSAFRSQTIEVVHVQTLNWPSLSIRRKQKAALCYRIVNNLSIIKPSFFTPHPCPHLRHTHSSPPYYPHTSSHLSFSVSNWNCLSVSPPAFKRLLKQLFELYIHAYIF